MNCREAQHQIFAERDSALDDSQRAALASHVAQCGDCQRIRDDLAAALTMWRQDVEKVAVPDAEREWYAVRRRIRGGAEVAQPARSRRNLLTWITVPLGAAAALAVAVFVTRPEPPAAAVPSAHPQIARADALEVPGNNASTMVFVDDKSRWLIVWASDAKRG